MAFLISYQWAPGLLRLLIIIIRLTAAMSTSIKTARKCGWTGVVVVYPVCPCQPRNRGLAHLSLVPSHLWPRVNHSEARTHTVCRCGAGLCLLPGRVLIWSHASSMHASMLPCFHPITNLLSRYTLPHFHGHNSTAQPQSRRRQGHRLCCPLPGVSSINF